MALWAALERANLQAALGTRDLIGQAKGILMERYKISGERAFLVLTRASQTSNRKLHNVADELVRRGTITGAGAPPPAPRRPSRGEAV